MYYFEQTDLEKYKENKIERLNLESRIKNRIFIELLETKSCSELEIVGKINLNFGYLNEFIISPEYYNTPSQIERIVTYLEHKDLLIIKEEIRKMLVFKSLKDTDGCTILLNQDVLNALMVQYDKIKKL
jgi:hypothetical protein